jgi:RNA polymerase sigma-70 factor (ECF subfamily)
MAAMELRDLYEEHASAIYGFLRNRVGYQEAEDLTSEVFLRAARALERYEDRGLPIRAWLLRIARNLVIEKARSARPVEGPITTEPHAPDGTDRVVLAIEGRVALDALRTLKDTHREVIDLRIIRDLSVAETAVVLDLSDEAVRALTHRALKALRAAHKSRWGNT